MADFALYCTKCGASTDWVSEEVKGFDPHSGDHKDRYRTICPNKSHILDGHHKSGWALSTHSADKCPLNEDEEEEVLP